jgi:hypothetical protein
MGLRHRQLLALNERRNRRNSDEEGASETLHINTAANVALATAALLGLLLTGAGSILQSMATRDQLQQSSEARDREFKKEASLFDARGEDGRLHLNNYSRHTVSAIQVILWRDVGKGKHDRLVFGSRNVAPCTSVTYKFHILKDGKKVTPRMGIVNIVYRDWEGKEWSVEPGGDGLVYVGEKYRSSVIRDGKLMAEWDKILKWPRTEKAIPDCSGA